MAIALITGGGSGIGAQTGIQMAGRGDAVILADINKEAADDVAARIVASGGKAESAALDVRDGTAFDALVSRVVADHGRIDIIFNNAGIGVGGPIEDLTADHWQRIVDINIMGVVNGIRAAYPHMMRQGDGHIVNLSSLFGLVAVPGQSGYNAAKFAVRGFTESVRQDLLVAGAPVQVTCVHPGGIKTGIARHGRATAGEDHEANSRLFDDHLARLEPSVAADQILRAMLRNQPRLLIGADARALHRLATVLGPRYQRLFAARAKSMQNRR